MSYIRFIAPGVIRYTCRSYSRGDIINCENKLTTDLINSGMSIDSLKDSILLLDFLAEGHDAELIAPLINYLSTLTGRDRIRILFNAVIDLDQLPYRARSFTTHFANQDGRFANSGDQSSVQLEQKFLCLARRPTPGRAKFVNRLLSIVSSVRVSFGSGFPEWSQEFQSYLPDHTLPILIDGDARRYTHNLASDVFRTCLFNIVLETSSQTDPESWRSVFLTEKTFKTFDLYQISIWFAVPGTVDQVRQLGFDLFDDVIDHSYDAETDPTTRMDLIMHEIKRLDDQYSLDDCQQLRRDLWPRLQANYTRLDQLTQDYTTAHDRLVAELIA